MQTYRYHKLKHHNDYKCDLFEIETVTLCVEVERTVASKDESEFVFRKRLTYLLMPVCSLEHRPKEQRHTTIVCLCPSVPSLPWCSPSLWEEANRRIQILTIIFT